MLGSQQPAERLRKNPGIDGGGRGGGIEKVETKELRTTIGPGCQCKKGKRRQKEDKNRDNRRKRALSERPNRARCVLLQNGVIQACTVQAIAWL